LKPFAEQEFERGSSVNDISVMHHSFFVSAQREKLFLQKKLAIRAIFPGLFKFLSYRLLWLSYKPSPGYD